MLLFKKILKSIGHLSVKRQCNAVHIHPKIEKIFRALERTKGCYQKSGHAWVRENILVFCRSPEFCDFRIDSLNTLSPWAIIPLKKQYLLPVGVTYNRRIGGPFRGVKTSVCMHVCQCIWRWYTNGIIQNKMK